MKETTNNQKKYDWSLFVRSEDDMMIEETRVKTNSAKYLYKKIISCMYDESGWMYYKYKRGYYYKNNKTGQITLTLEYDPKDNTIWTQY